MNKEQKVFEEKGKNCTNYLHLHFPIAIIQIHPTVNILALFPKSEM